MASSRFTRGFSIFESANLNLALWFYRDLLGWELKYRFPPAGDVVDYVALRLGTSELGIGKVAPGAVAPSRSKGALTICVYARDTDLAVDFLRAQGVAVTSEPRDMPWGERVGYVLDPDGNAVMICSPSRSA